MLGLFFAGLASSDEFLTPTVRQSPAQPANYLFVHGQLGGLFPFVILEVVQNVGDLPPSHILFKPTYAAAEE
jgi:hypothetical protein